MSLFDLGKALGYLAMPAGLLWVLILGIAYLLLRRRQWLAGILVLGVWALYAVVGNYYVGTALLAGLERTIPPLEDGGEPFDAVLVLGGGSDLDPTGRPILGEAGDRIIAAARLWHAGRARTLVAGGTGRDLVAGSRDLGQETRAIWLSLGVPDGAIEVVREECLNTRDEIAAYRRLRDLRHWRRMALVSSASHLPRALRLAEKAGFAVTPVGADWRGRRHALQVQRLVPTGYGFHLVSTACWEYLGRRLGK
ncbi:YdcF family protein [Mesoterricola silvestris]|uniref:DUF218 domain-containing protein n=1 Tax=Mesoterricola silvestris TaxID=2927979 RepID=A0AA48GQ91_9BACT|nr:YdcF family protein [Mesoterricola silvestris]BDU72017.1 hypothetical protein METEAL_11910 [Mesoterricola silvestris]